MNIVVIGRGKVGRGLARALNAAGVETRLARGRAKSRSAVRDADVVVLAVPDDAIVQVAGSIAPHLEPGAVVVHCAGARGTDELSLCETAGAEVGAMHPLVSFADARRTPDLQGTTFVIDGSPAAKRATRQLVRAMGARAVAAPVHGAAYHAAAALVANGAAALATAGVGVLEALGMGGRDAERAMGALLRTVAENVSEVGVPDALTGPVARGDDRTVTGHRRALGKVDRGARDAYDAVAPAILRCAIAAGLPKSRARAVRKAITR